MYSEKCGYIQIYKQSRSLIYHFRICKILKDDQKLGQMHADQMLFKTQKYLIGSCVFHHVNKKSFLHKCFSILGLSFEPGEILNILTVMMCSNSNSNMNK